MLALFLATALVIRGGALCPTASAIEAQLHTRDLADDTRDSVGPPLTARLDPIGAGERVHLTLLAEDSGGGRVLAQRDLPPGSCEDLARAAATLIAAWRTEFQRTEPRFRLRPPALIDDNRTTTPLEFDVGASLAASMAGTTFTADGSLAALLGRRGGRVLGRAALTAGGIRNLTLGDASPHARFLRAGFSLGPDVRFRPGRWLLDVFAEATVALAYVDAVGFVNNFHAYALDLALGGGLRAGWKLGPVLPFLQARVAGWLTGQSVSATGPDGGTSKVPPFELFLELGVAFGRF